MPHSSFRPALIHTTELTAWLDALRLVRLVRGRPLADDERRGQACRASWAAARNLERARDQCGEVRAHHLRIARQRVLQTAAAYASTDAEVAETATRIVARLGALARAA